MRLPGWTSRATHSASRLAIVPLEVRWPRPGEGSPNMTRSWSTTSTSSPLAPGPAVERVVVGVDEHRRQVAGHGHRVRRLEHLPGVARVEEGVVVGHPLAEGVPRGGQPLRVGLARGVRVVGAEPRLPRLDERRWPWGRGRRAGAEREGGGTAADARTSRPALAALASRVDRCASGAARRPAGRATASRHARDRRGERDRRCCRHSIAARRPASSRRTTAAAAAAGSLPR